MKKLKREKLKKRLVMRAKLFLKFPSRKTSAGLSVVQAIKHAQEVKRRADDYYKVSERIGDFIVTRTYSRGTHLFCKEHWESIPGTNARRASIHDSHTAWANEHNAHQDFAKRSDHSRGR